MTDGGRTQGKTAREHVGSLSGKNWTLKRTLIKFRKRADSPKLPQERGLQGRSHAAEVAPTKGIRSNSSCRTKVMGEPVSKSATHLNCVKASTPPCIAILVMNETLSSVTVPPTRQGACSDCARPRPTPEAMSRPFWVWSAGASKK